MNPKPGNPRPPSAADICTRIREMQEATEVTFTDDEVKGIVCQSLNETRSLSGIQHWEAVVVAKCVQILERRSTSASPGGDK